MVLTSLSGKITSTTTKNFLTILDVFKLRLNREKQKER